VNYSINYTFSLIDRFSGGAAGLVAAMARIERASRAMGGALAAVAAGGALVGMFSSAVQAAQGWEAAMANVRRTADLSRQEMIAYGKDALKLSVQLGTPVEKVAGMMTTVAQTGVRDRRMLAAYAELTGKAAVAWDDITPERAATAIGTMGQQWFGDLSVDESIARVRQLGDAINELSNRSNFKAPELLKAYERGGVKAKDFGLTAEQFAAYAGTALSVSERSGELQGTRSRMTFEHLGRKLAKPTKDTALAARALGFRSVAEMRNFVYGQNRQDALLGLMERFNSVDDRVKDRVLGGMLDSRSGAQFRNVAKNLNEYKRQLAIVDDDYARRFSGDKDFMEWLRGTGKHADLVDHLERYGKILTRVGSLEREFAKKSDTLKFAVDQRNAAWQRVQVTMGEPLLEPLAGANRWMADVLGSFADMAEANPATARTLWYGLGASLAASLFAGIWAGMTARAGTSLLGRLLIGGSVAAATLTLSVALVGAGAWIFYNWDAFKASLSEPLSIKIDWPEAPAWLQWLWQNFAKVSSMRDAEINERAARFRAETAFEGEHGPTYALNPSTRAAMAAAERAAAEYSVRALENPMLRFPSPNLVDPTWWQSKRGFDRQNDAGMLNWQDGRDSINGAQLAASIPQSIAVTSTFEATFAPAQVNVNVTGTVNGPVQGSGSGTLQAEPARGTSMPSVGTGTSINAPNPSYF
jgi:TP901 family phage tail tape measure protein